MRLLALIIYVLAELQPDGSALISEQWDIDVVSGTEMYLKRGNLSDIVISDFSVSENGIEFVNEGIWDYRRSIDGKAGRCGVIDDGKECELCWGIGSYGHHSFNIRYRMSNAVKSMDDYDKLHLQFVSPGINPVPESVKVEIQAPVPLNGDNTRLWGFGFEGTTSLNDDGRAVFETTAPLGQDGSVIVLLRFDKGIFSSRSIERDSFEDTLSKALEGSSFDDDREGSIWDILAPLIFFILFISGSLIISGAVRKARKEQVLGCNEKDIKWYRDIPCDGDILGADYILKSLGEGGRDTIASAMILRMIDKDIIRVSNDARGNIEMSFNPSADQSVLSPSEAGLLEMMKEASGRDLVLQKNEFKRWSTNHNAAVARWASSLKDEGKRHLEEAKLLTAGKFNKKGQQTARNLVGFRNFLNDFTLIRERYSKEVGLWRDLLIFGALFGIAEKVAGELKEINPQAFEEVFAGDSDTTLRTLRNVRYMADSITNAKALHSGTGASRGGFGGVSSFGGGRGFSGGGFGGGVR